MSEITFDTIIAYSIKRYCFFCNKILNFGGRDIQENACTKKYHSCSFLISIYSLVKSAKSKMFIPKRLEAFESLNPGDQYASKT